MDVRRVFAIQVLEQLARALQDMSDESFDELMKGELQASVSFVRSAPRRSDRRKRVAPISDETLRFVHARLTSASSREEGQRIVKEAFEHKEDLFVFAKYLDLPVQRKDAADRIRDKVVTHTVGRRLSGKAVRGDFGMVIGPRGVVQSEPDRAC